MRVGSVLVGFAALALLLTAFGARLYSRSLSSALLLVVLVSLAIAIGLHVRFLLLEVRSLMPRFKRLEGKDHEAADF